MSVSIDCLFSSMNHIVMCLVILDCILDIVLMYCKAYGFYYVPLKNIVVVFVCFIRHLLCLNSNTKLYLSCGGQKLKSLISSINLSWSAWKLSHACGALESARDLDGVYVQNLALPSEAFSIFGFLFSFSS